MAAGRHLPDLSTVLPRTPSGDGVGDLAGIAARLDHLRRASRSTAIWLSPIFTLADGRLRLRRRRLLRRRPGLRHARRTSTSWSRRRHARDIKLILDWVPNHSSDQHPWFLESPLQPRQPQARLVRLARRGRADAERLRSRCSRPAAPAWTLDEATGQYYLHSFMPEQPDLNWDNPEVVAAMHDTLRFWFDRGVDGLRLDAIAKIAKDPLLRDHQGASQAATTRTGSRSTSSCAASAGSSTNTTTG